MTMRAVVLTLALVALAIGRGWATTVVAPTFDELVAKAQYVFLGEVVARQSEWRETASGRAIYTLVTFKVLEPIKGITSVQTALEFLGGEVGDEGLRVAGMPVFAVGDRDILFAHGGPRTMSPLVGFMHGRLRVLRDRSGREFIATYDGRPLASPKEFGVAGLTGGATVSRPMTVRELIAQIRQTINAQARRP